MTHEQKQAAINEKIAEMKAIAESIKPDDSIASAIQKGLLCVMIRADIDLIISQPIDPIKGEIRFAHNRKEVTDIKTLGRIGEIKQGLTVCHGGRKYTTGNSRAGEVELWSNGLFVKVVKIKCLILLTDENQKDK